MPPALQNPFILWVVITAALGGLAYAFLRKELRVRATVYGALIAAALVAMWPPYEHNGVPGKIHLGLDLRGGVHLVLQVQTDDALKVTVDDRVQAIRQEVADKGITVAKIERTSPTSYVVSGIEPARIKDVQDILSDYARSSTEPGGWDVHSRGNGTFEVDMSDALVHNLNDRTVKEEIRTLERRVNQLGVTEPVIAAQGDRGDQILVQLPGVTDIEQAKRVISETAQLSLKLVENSSDSRENLLASSGGKVPANMEVVTGRGEEPGEEVYYLLHKESVVTGRDLKNARMSVDQYNQPAVSFTLNPNGASKFKSFTGRNIGRRIAIVLDNRVESAPTVQSKIGAEGQITGQFTAERADELAKVLRAGALPASLKYLQELTVGASLGRDSIRSGIIASLAGLVFIGIFMLVYYRLSGLNAVVALAVNLILLFGTMAYVGATLTLPGIAGIILTIGVGVDTNVLVFERIREELRHGKTVKAAIAAGFDRVWILIIDTHATALIAATILFQFGTGPIKGFAVTLVVGLIANLFASFFLSKFIFDWVLGKRPVASLSI